MSRAYVHADNGTRSDDHASAERAAPRARQARDPRHRIEAEIPFQLQRIRGPYTLDAGLAAYEQHLGLAT